MKYLYALHDEGGEHLMADRPGSVVITEAIGCDPSDMSGRDYRHLADRGFTVVVRLNNGYAPGGTYPRPAQYHDFASRCANFAKASQGVSWYIVGNEPNHANERPGGQFIMPDLAAACFNLCYEAIKQVQPHVGIVTPPVAPWDATTTYPGNEMGDWIIYAHDMWHFIRACDAIGLHTYTHGASPALITSEARMDADGFRHRRYEFRTYLDFLEVVPAKKRHLPVFITETDQTDAWTDANTGWAQAAYAEIARHNRKANTQKVYLLALFRWQVEHDQWGIANKPGVHADFRAAVGQGYSAPDREAQTTYLPAVVSASTPPADPALPPRETDARAERRGTRIEAADVEPGQPYWRVVRLVTANEEESDRFGPDRHLLANVLIDGQRRADFPLLVTWGGGGAGERAIIFTKHNPNFAFSADFPLTPGEFTIQVADGTPSERVVGVKMGDFDSEGRWNPGAHTSTLVEFALTTMPKRQPAPKPQPPAPAPSPEPQPAPSPAANYLIWPADAPRTQRWGENPIYYQEVLGIPYHNGVDHGTPEGTPVRAMSDGEVMYVGTDPGYGNYVRVYHPHLGIHTFVAHLKEVKVAVGAMVKQGDVIALSGSTGLTAATIHEDGSADTSRPAPHTHTEIRLGSRDAYAEGTFGHSNGRIDPEAAMYLINSIAAGGTGTVAPIDPLVAEALWQVESSGAGFEDGELKIRLEAHIFEGYLSNPTVFARHFRYDPVNLLNAEYRVNESSPWVAYHQEGQTGEWGAFAVAAMLNRTAALLSISMGAPQIMGFNYAVIGYNTPQQMFEAFSRALAPQIMGFYQLCQHKKLAEPMRQRNWPEIVRRYNGTGLEAIYVPRLVAAYQALGGT